MKSVLLLESMFQGLINSGIKPTTILHAFQNVCAHGCILDDNGWNVTDDNLEGLFLGLDVSIKSLRSMEQ